ncbi:MAG TPA: hypothetical protein VMT46_09390 [Anaerolineaceae bacterium]|nr:hypothetical protein [Anaerolineaceae bacterium]
MPEHKPSDRLVDYQIRVDGRISPIWSCWFDGFSLAYEGDQTVLTGRVIDQAALHGILACLRDLGLPLVSLFRQ